MFLSGVNRRLWVELVWGLLFSFLVGLLSGLVLSPQLLLLNCLLLPSLVRFCFMYFGAVRCVCVCDIDIKYTFGLCPWFLVGPSNVVNKLTFGFCLQFLK